MTPRRRHIGSAGISLLTVLALLCGVLGAALDPTFVGEHECGPGCACAPITCACPHDEAEPATTFSAEAELAPANGCGNGVLTVVASSTATLVARRDPVSINVARVATSDHSLRATAAIDAAEARGPPSPASVI